MKTANIDEVYGKSGYEVLVSDLPWKLHATHGVSLEITFSAMAEQKLIPAWDLLFKAALKDGANLSRLSDRICNVIGEAYPYKVAKAIRACLPFLVAIVEES